MADRFLRAIQDLHRLRHDIESMNDAEACDLIQDLGNDATEDWVFAARTAQLPPPDLNWCWLFLGGRGTGKSHSMSAAVHLAVRAGIKRIHLIAPRSSNIRGSVGAFPFGSVPGANCRHPPRPTRWLLDTLPTGCAASLSKLRRRLTTSYCSQPATNDVRLGSQAAVEARAREVRSTPDGGRAGDFELLRLGGHFRTRP
jgi:hypothetical protein